MTLTIEAYGQQISFVLSDEATTPELMRAFVAIACGIGYSRRGFVELLKDGDPDNWDDAWPETSNVK